MVIHCTQSKTVPGAVGLPVVFESHKKESMRRLKLLFIVAVFAYTPSIGQPSIIPKPNETVVGTGSFALSAQSVIVADKGAQNTADFLSGYLKEYYGLNIPASATGKTTSAISIKIKADASKPEGAYTLVVRPGSVLVEGANEAGCFYGVQTLIQLLPPTKTKTVSIAAVTVKDAPRFGYRGAMLDVGRHFYSADYVKRFIDYLALHKMNRLHWHLTEDQGWRIEIKKYPKLTEIGAWRDGTIIGNHPGKGNTNQRYGGFYTQEQVKDIVAYAAARYITVVPEIEMPGHASAAIAAYPELSCFPDEASKNYYVKNSPLAGDGSGKHVIQSWGVYADVFVPSDNTFKFLENVLDEVLELFPSKYIHIGGDEAPKDNWKRSTFCQQLIKENNLKDEHGLQSYFIQRIEKYLNGKGRQIIGWDEILEGGLAPNATVMSWRGEKGGIEAAKQKHDVIMTPTTYVYLDYAQTKKEDSLVIGGYLPLSTVYGYEPVPAEITPEEAPHVLGGQGNLWTEYINNPSKLEYVAFPRLTALSEVLWSDKKQRDFKDFDQRLQLQFKRYQLWGVNYCKKQE